MDEWKFLLDGVDDPYKETLPKVTEFDLFLPWACNQYSIENEVIITRATQEVYVGATITRKRLLSRRNMSMLLKEKVVEDTPVPDDDDVLSEKSVSDVEKSIPVRLKTIYDFNDKLVQIKFLKNVLVPRKVWQVIGLMIPYQRYLTSIIINSGLNIEGLYEIAKFLPDSQITELCLDNTYLYNAQYHILLTHGKLKHLSLVRCSINDAILKMITDQLRLPTPASKVLTALNLSTNRITDVGAKYVADMLRSNRQLSYLNLAGNMITDEGGLKVLDIFQKFNLEPEELLQSKARYMDYIENKNELVQQFIVQLQVSKDLKKKSAWKSLVSNRQKSNYDAIAAEERMLQEKAEYMAENKLGPYYDPYYPHNTESRGNVVSCLGNNSMCYLNLAYNNLSYACVSKLLQVLKSQRSQNRTPRGLIKVLFEGNFMPQKCKEYDEINRIFAGNAYQPQMRMKSVKSSNRLE